MTENKKQENLESDAQIDYEEGRMNNGTIGGNMGIISKPLEDKTDKSVDSEDKDENTKEADVGTNSTSGNVEDSAAEK